LVAEGTGSGGVAARVKRAFSHSRPTQLLSQRSRAAAAARSGMRSR
jgi:hypothetical protein